MPRACVIVLDAVGAGELPDAAEFGDEGSDTLGNVARAVGGLDLPEPGGARASATSSRSRAARRSRARRRSPAGCSSARRARTRRSGHWELMGDRHAAGAADVPARVPARRDRPVHAQTGRGVLGNKPASGTEIIQELGEEHQQTGKWIVYTSADSVFQIAAHEETIPLEELYEGCRAAREILTGKHAVGRVIARPFIGEPGNYERTPNRHDFSLEPRRPNYLTLDPRRGRTRCTASGRSPTSSPAGHRRVAPDEVERRGDQR